LFHGASPSQLCLMIGFLPYMLECVKVKYGRGKPFP
jgi:hypothetical protein